MLFELIGARYERRSILITANQISFGMQNIAGQITRFFHFVTEGLIKRFCNRTDGLAAVGPRRGPVRECLPNGIPSSMPAPFPSIELESEICPAGIRFR
ncbi:hypothetical protein ACVWXO_000911 [Bradyrhizobium sp. LM2.7]